MTITNKMKCILLTLLGITALQPSLAVENSLLWKVTSKSGKVSHLFGTIHLPDSNVFRQRDVVLTALEKSSSFYAEIDLDSMLTAIDPMTMMLPKGKTLADYYSKEELKELRALLNERLGPMAMMAERMKPAAIAVLAMMDDSEPTASTTVDQFLWSHAKQHGISVRGIESVKEQLDLLDSIPPRLVLEALREDSNSATQVDRLVNAYANEHLDEISKLVDSVSSVETFMSKINDDRNVKMADRLVTPLNNGNTFIAVGSAHLAGEQGLLAALKKRGFAVEAVLGGKRVQWLRSGAK